MNILKPQLVGDIRGHFRVPSYQRGYRWGKDQVNALLNDIMQNGTNPYCLQPVVVRRLTKSQNVEPQDVEYELIDGQQRLTTLYLIYACLSDLSGGFIADAPQSLSYDTRPGSENFLKSINEDLSNENIEYWHMANASKTIKEYFDKSVNGRRDTARIQDFNKYLSQNVNVLWYEIPDNEDGNSLFKRLNIGKIPLTSSELVKALFMREAPKDSSLSNRINEVAMQWDLIENQLQDPGLWSFLSNESPDAYPTRIDLVLNLIADEKMPENDIKSEDPLKTFFFFNECQDELAKQWERIYTTFLTLKEWYNNSELYHRIGYLIYVGKTLKDIFQASQGKKKSEFVKYLDEEMSKTIKMPPGREIEDLRYLTEKGLKNDQPLIQNILVLFNVVSSLRHKCEGHKFPFDNLKHGHWSLEHIHAQNSQGLNRNESRLRWLNDHIRALENLDPQCHILEVACKLRDSLAHMITNNIRREIGSDFEAVHQQIVAALSANENMSDAAMHALSNLALLIDQDNAALNNSVFEVKRQKVIEWDKAGKWIPFCTRMVFYKYYTPKQSSQLYYWSKEDRTSYLEAIKNELSPYLSQNDEPNSESYDEE